MDTYPLMGLIERLVVQNQSLNQAHEGVCIHCGCVAIGDGELWVDFVSSFTALN